VVETVRFFNHLQRAWNTRVQDFIRTELACPVLINAGNWRTASQTHLLDAERWSYAANDLIAVNRYVTGVHQNPETPYRAGYTLDPGDQFTDPSACRDPLRLPTAMRQVAGLPSLITESTWVSPLTNRGEGPFLIAASAASAGIDGFVWFAVDRPAWDGEQRKFQVADPMTLGGFPAAALVYRRGDIACAPVAVQEVRTLDAVLGSQPAALPEESGYDPNRDAGTPLPEAPQGSIDPLAYLVGPVAWRVGDTPSVTAPPPMADRRLVSNGTGEVCYDLAAGRTMVVTPDAVGIAGDLTGQHRLGRIQVSSSMTAATCWVVSLDDAPLTTAKRILVQVGVPARPSEWWCEPVTVTHEQVTQPGYRIGHLGHAPWQVQHVDLRVRIPRPDLGHAWVLDPALRRSGRATLERNAGGIAFQFPTDALYVVLETAP
jgi:hypothetical protein